MNRGLVVAMFAAALGLMVVGCEEEIVQGQAPPPPVNRKATVAANDGGVVDEGGPPQVEYQETDFAETERSRDPFRSYASMFADEARSKVRSQREVILNQYAVDELKLIGLVTRAVPHKAMLVDPTGKGHVVIRGQFIGRAERVQSGGQTGAEYEINWRVDRIREGDIVLIREDPSLPDVPSATRVIPLRPEGSIVQE